MPLISIIIPVYNCEKYLSRCLDSVINQTFKDTEILCIDCGSTDNSLNILHIYAQNDSRISIINQEGTTQNAVKNKGIEIANGKYITFIESNVWLNNEYCKLLYDAIEEFDVDISTAGIVCKNSKNGNLQFQTVSEYRDVNDIIKVLNGNYSAVGKLFRTKKIKNISFKEDFFYEDISYIIRVIDKCPSLVTVPNALYFCEKQKEKLTEKCKNDIIENRLEAIKYANEHYIKINNLIINNRYFFFEKKIYTDREEFYFCGSKIFTKVIDYNPNKIFVILILACFGDILVRNALVQNIKRIFPTSKVVFIVDKPWVEVAKYSKDVDEVYAFDKKGEHKGLFGMFKFVNKFPYKKMDYLLPMHLTARIKILIKLLRPKLLLNGSSGNTMQELCISYLDSITNKKTVNVPIKYQPNFNLSQELEQVFKEGNRYIALCTTSKLPEKDMPVNIAIDLVNKLNCENYNVIYTGVGEKAKVYAETLKNNNCRFINLVNKTSIQELAGVIKRCNALISVDTGTMHLGYAIQVPTVCIFYKKNVIQLWAPDEKLYGNVKVISSNYSAENIFSKLEQILEVAYE